MLICQGVQSTDKVFKSDKVTLVTIDCDKEEDKCKAAGIKGYPTLVLNGETFQGDASNKDDVDKLELLLNKRMNWNK